MHIKMVNKLRYIARLILIISFLAALCPVPGVCLCLEADQACCGTTRSTEPVFQAQKTYPVQSCCDEHEANSHGCCHIEQVQPVSKLSFLHTSARNDNYDPGWIVTARHLDNTAEISQARSRINGFFSGKFTPLIPVFLLNLSFLC